MIIVYGEGRGFRVVWLLEEMARKNIGYALGEVEQAYLTRLRARAGYRRALDVCRATRGWWTS